jgi:hypothetical protein
MLRARVKRLARELAGAPSPADGDRALATLSVDADEIDPLVREIDPGAATALRIGSGGGLPLDRARLTADAVRVGPGVFSRVPGRDARVSLLRRARALSEGVVVLHVALAEERTHAGRLLLDAPRRALRAVGARAPEPGDRFPGSGFVHLFFDDEALLEEIAQAGLAPRARRGGRLLLVPSDGRPAEAAEDPEAFWRELGRVAGAFAAAEQARRGEAPERAVAAMRARGEGQLERGPIGRARLRRAIGWLDALAPGGANCYRRTLLELALDRGAAGETLVFGLDVGRTGHVAFKDREDRVFDVAFELPPGPSRRP